MSVNSTLKMKCIVRGDPPPKVNWTKNGARLAYHNNTVIIKHATSNDIGRYECIAVNRAGKINATIWIDVTGKN